MRPKLEAAFHQFILIALLERKPVKFGINWLFDFYHYYGSLNSSQNRLKIGKCIKRVLFYLAVLVANSLKQNRFPKSSKLIWPKMAISLI